MKHTLRILSFIILTFTAANLQAQVTRLANNNNIQYGVPFANLGLMVDDNGALWKTDGTVAGTAIFTTKVIKDTSQEAAYFDNKVFFSGFTVTGGSELWATNGT